MPVRTETHAARCLISWGSSSPPPSQGGGPGASPGGITMRVAPAGIGVREASRYADAVSVVQRSRTPPSTGGNAGSNPVGHTDETERCARVRGSSGRQSAPSMGRPRVQIPSATSRLGSRSTAAKYGALELGSSPCAFER